MSEGGPLPSFSVAGRHVLITGGAGGIGGAFANAFLAHGAEVTVTDVREPPPQLLQAGARYRELDVTDDAAVTALATALERLDVLVCCAGTLGRWREFELEEFTRVVEVNLHANMRLATRLHAHLKAARGCVINIASMYSVFGAPHAPAYTASKTALVGLTRSLAVAWMADGIRVNAIAPGWVRTEISRRGREDPAFNRRVLERLPAGRWAEPEEIAGAAVFLASPAAAMITGVVLPVDGGYSAT